MFAIDAPVDEAFISATEMMWMIPVYCEVVQHLLHIRLLEDEIKFGQVCFLTRRLCDVWQYAPLMCWRATIASNCFESTGLICVKMIIT